MAAEGDFVNEIRQYFPPETPEEVILGVLNDPELYNQYMDQLQDQFTLAHQQYDVYNECLLPVASQAWESVWMMLVFSITLRFIALLRPPLAFLHLLSASLGCVLLWKFYGVDASHVLFSCALLYAVSQFTCNGLHMVFVMAMQLLLNEYFLLDPVKWNKIKGSVMIVSMNIVSGVFEMSHSSSQARVGILEFLGYILNPATVIFGPFLTFEDYLQINAAHPLSIGWLLCCLKSFFISTCCLLWSSCGTTYYLPKLESYFPIISNNTWWDAYKVALSFRFSHYFVCYCSETSCLLAGIGIINKTPSEATETNAECSGIVWSKPISRLSQVELPRSLVDVVTNWNLPHHHWLKQYIFKPTRRFGVLPAILLTYLASAMLHSMNFQLSVVLLSIGVFAYIESVCRHMLAEMLNACVEARPCKDACTHTHKKGKFWVIGLNLFFTVGAMWNLAYLGCLFDNSDEEEKGYSMAHALNKWSSYSYVNHWTMVVLFVTQRLVHAGKLF